jgi:hypothetical protein
MFLDDVRFATTGFVTHEEKGPMSVTLLTATELVIVDVVFGASAAAALRAGTPLGDLLAGQNSLQKSETRIPLSRLQSISWIDRENGVEITWLDDNQRRRRKTTYVSKPAARGQILEGLSEQLRYPLRIASAPAGIWRIAWSQLVGASLSVVLTVVFLYFWNSQEIARVQGGNIAIWLGPKGCALVGAVFVIACLASARRRLTPRPAQHCWKVRGTNK